MQKSVIKECDLIDGVNDNLVENPLACTFNISSWACPKDGSPSNVTCLEPQQLSAVKAVYQGPIRSDFPNVSLYPGLSLASEAGWFLPSVSGALSNAFSIPLLQNTLFNNLSYDPATFDWSTQVDLLDEKLGPMINSINTNLSAFRNNGGKMILYTGWADPNIAPMWSIQYAEAVTRGTLGKETSITDNDFMKLVMIPGGGHCGANIAKYPNVPANYDVSTAMVEWVEKKNDLREGIKSWGPTNGQTRTRKLCTWPLVAKLKEGRDIDDWESYVCG